MTTFEALDLMVSFATLMIAVIVLSYTFTSKK